MREACNKVGIIFKINEWISWITRVSFTKASNKLEADIIRLPSKERVALTPSDSLDPKDE